MMRKQLIPIKFATMSNLKLGRIMNS